jgi:hypothetical protein
MVGPDMENLLSIAGRGSGAARPGGPPREIYLNGLGEELHMEIAPPLR